MYVAINYIQCRENYRARFEDLLNTRAMAIDTMPGFQRMEVLRPQSGEDAYLIISYWDHESFFHEWSVSPQFLEGHRRGFSDIAKAREEGQEPPMKSTFKTYTILTT